MMNAAVHDTIKITREIAGSPDLVFAAWADPGARAVWGPPSKEEAMAFLETDFRVGGRDVHVCGMKDDLRFRVETFYHDIQNASRLLFTERVSAGNAVLGASLITVELSQAGQATRLDLTVQVVSLVGGDLVAGNRNGWNAALANLDDYRKEATP